MNIIALMKNGCCILVMVLTLASCGDKKNKEETTAKADSIPKPTTKNQILGVARIEPEDGIMSLTAGTSGRVLSVMIEDNQAVKKGQVLLDVEVVLENAQLRQAQSKVGTQQATIAANQATLEALKITLNNARDNYERNLELYKGNAQTQQALNDSKATFDKLTKDLQTAEANIRQAQAKVEEIKADINYYRAVVEKKRVGALMGGKVLKVLVKTGDFVNNDTKIADFAPDGALFAKTEVDELYAERVQLGQKVFILSQTSGDTLATGVVSYAADYLKQKSLFKDQSTEQEDRRVRDVSIRLESGKMPLIGSRVDCIIVLK
ncbi:HlyD family secretion protein [Runella sp. CRIBMP]|uniref:HlyD family secretion protein n=1 Tax=Runella sp. CRIBMP TaxID=2683261 RepID=UPI001E2FBE54|nr:biotin/lipoyl-binding protein [Runella sp. CRIBMP]